MSELLEELLLLIHRESWSDIDLSILCLRISEVKLLFDRFCFSSDNTNNKSAIVESSADEVSRGTRLRRFFMPCGGGRGSKGGGRGGKGGRNGSGKGRGR